MRKITNELIEKIIEGRDTKYTDKYLDKMIKRRMKKAKKMFDSCEIEVYDSHDSLFLIEDEGECRLVRPEENQLLEDVQKLIRIRMCF
jgi:hypothetical protein